MKATEEQHILMGIPVFIPEGIPPYKPYKGSIQVAADCCGRFVWQGPSQQLYKSEHPEVKILCAFCAIEHGITTENTEFRALTTKGEGD